jgi:glycerate 2-kinase
VPEGPLRLLAVGKAAAVMAHAALDRIGSRVTRAVVITPPGSETVAQSLEACASTVTVVTGDHPIPGEGSERAGRDVLALATATDSARCLLVLLSGGASALMAAPAEGVTLADKQQTTDRLLREGVTIDALNTVRKHLSRVKGGWLAASANTSVVTLAISDVVGDDPGVIGSGPTVADPSSFADAREIVTRAGGLAAFPRAVVKRLDAGAAGRVPETPKPGDPRLRNCIWTLVGGRSDAMAAAAARARTVGFDVQVQDRAVVGEARRAAAEWLPWLFGALRRPGPVCLISSGETTVRVTGSGRGGRNQEFALAMVEAFARAGRPVALASIGTDGVDGPTDAAGAVVRENTLLRARAAGLPPPDRFLADNDAYRFFDQLGDLIRTGPTGTNVGDLQVCVIGAASPPDRGPTSSIALDV